jgi:hypothetical protein
MKTDANDFEVESQLACTLEDFRSSAHAMAERPESFWADQRRSIMARLGTHRKAASFRPVLAWGAAIAVVLAVLALLVEGPRALPAPDFAAGYDQELLSDVDRLTEAEAPLALEPALILANEIAEKSRLRER